jgi:predicted PurR-regulated permease PerM
LKTALEWIFANLDRVFSGLAKVAGYAFVFLLALFYFLRDGRIIIKNFISWSPLIDSHDEYITKTLKRAIQSVFAGTVVVSVIQGILTGIGFALFGIPAPAVWGSIAAVAAFIPGIGTSLVLIPGIIYLFVTHGFVPAIGLAIWGAVAVGLVDNILGPYLINRGINVHPFLILISVLGGLVVFGIVGFLLGPLILAFLFALLEIYRHSFSGSTDAK